MKYALYKQEQAQEIITLFNNTFSDSEGKEEGALIAKLVEDFLTLPTKDEDLYVFIAQDESERIIGSIIFSRLSFPNGENIFLLAPRGRCNRVSWARCRSRIDQVWVSDTERKRHHRCHYLRGYQLLLKNRIRSNQSGHNSSSARLVLP